MTGISLEWTLLEESIDLGVCASVLRIFASRLEELTGEDDHDAVGVGENGGQPVLSCSLTHSLDKLVLDNVKLLLSMLCDLTSNITRLDLVSRLPNLTPGQAEAEDGGHV